MKPLTKEQIQEWLNTPSPPIPNGLLDELRGYADDLVLKNKVLRVHSKCIRQRHIALADKIEVKYRHYMPKSDLAMAFGYSLMAEKQQKDES